VAVSRLRVAIETQYARGTATGLGVYATALAKALEARTDVDVVELHDPRFDVWRFDRRVYWDQIRAPRLAAAAHADVVHFTGGTLPLHAPHPCVVTVHDVAWLREAVEGRAYSQLYFGAFQRWLVRRADAIATDTAVVRDDILSLLRLPGSRVVVCGCGVDSSWFEVGRARCEPPYLLCVGTVEERKDLVTVVRALAELPTIRLVSAGPHTGYAARVRAEAEAIGVNGRVELRGFVDDATLRSLYAGAAALLFPSRYEGFGLPALQALAAGVPVIASDLPVLREVLGDWAFFAPAGDSSAFAECVRSIMRGGVEVDALTLGGRAHAQRLDWPHVAERMVQLYRAVREAGSAAPRS
jgi:glycosyltransferase involved in cell wall biosynthesis